MQRLANMPWIDAARLLGDLSRVADALARPLFFEPFLRPMVWGERRLEKHLGKRLPEETRYGESWELSSHSLHVSRVADGPLAGVSLEDLTSRHHEALYGRSRHGGSPFPLLFKFLDAHDRLSIQVHPDDEKARFLLGEENGKTEAWIVLHADPGSRIHAGLLPGVTRTDVEQHLRHGSLEDCLHALSPREGDCLFLPAGTVHAVGGGVLLAEVQQSSDATFRLYDWNRPGMDGKPRPLHIKESLESINWDAGPVLPVKPTPLARPEPGVEAERLVHCAYFSIDRYRVSGTLEVADDEQLAVWMVLSGTGSLQAGGGPARQLGTGSTVLVPAGCGAVTWKCEQTATLLHVRLI